MGTGTNLTCKPPFAPEEFIRAALAATAND